MKTQRIAFSILFILVSSCLLAQEWKPVEGKMMTPFGKKLTADKVWQEYPRPQMVRSEWVNLNGLWDYAIRPVENKTVSAYDGKILVPFCAESALSGVAKDVKKENNLWYRRNFQVPANWSGKQTLLHFGAVDYQTVVWINGKKAGEHTGGNVPFSFDITPFLKKKGEQEIIVSVWDPTDEGYQPRGKQVNKPSGIWYTPVTGIWQTVWLEPVEKTAIQSFYPVSNIDNGTITFNVDVANSKAGDLLKIKVKDGDQLVAEVEGKAGQSVVAGIKNAQLWSPDAPFLYDLEISLLRGNKELDKITSYCAMRKVSIGKNSNGQTAILLNNEALFQYGTLDQGWWPDGLLTPPSEEAMKYDLLMLKKMGFNMLRKHIKVEPARLYYDCDKLGLLVWQDMPSGFKTSEERENNRMPRDEKDWDKPKDAAKLFEAELKAMIDNLRFFPSIVMWVNFNEGWGQYDTERIFNWVKAYDPSRLVNAVSGWTDRNVGDVYDMHQYPGPCAEPYQRFPGRAVVLGEFGGLGWPIENHLWFTNRKSGGYETFHDGIKLYDRYIQLVQNLKAARYTGIAAAVYTQTTDVEGEVNGMLTYDRELCKIDPQVLRTLHADLYTPLPVIQVFNDDSRLQTNSILVRNEAPSFTKADKWETKQGMVDMRKGDEKWFKKEFNIDKKANGYYLSLSSNGEVEVFVNGQRVESRYIDSWRHYESINLSQYLDYFRKGQNDIIVHIKCTRAGKPADFGVYGY
ncbi:glycoside hydrolase family 2 protein [Viscerimonas tarda]